VRIFDPDPALLSVARGDTPADILFRGGRVVNVFTGEIEETDVAVWQDRIAALGSGYEGTRVVELEGAYLLPGFIDAHVHIESSLVTPREFARAVVPRGTTTAVTDPHEIANVHGTEGVRYMLADSEELPLTVFVMASSCVPATHMSTSGAALDRPDLETLLEHDRVLGLAEVMNFPGVITGSDDVLDKIRSFAGHPIDGHAPGVRGPALNAYVAGGPQSDHECTSVDEAQEKLRRGLFLLVREATNARNLEALLPVLTGAGLWRAALCTDDRTPPDLLDEGGIDAMVRRIIAAGTDPVDAIRLATLNAAEYFGLRDRGAVAPGRRADLLVVDDLQDLVVRNVWCGGVLAAEDGTALAWDLADPPPPPAPSMHVRLEAKSFRMRAREGLVRVIEVIPDQIVTGTRELEPALQAGEVVADPIRDVLKIAVVERHTDIGRVGLGLVTGMGLKRGALAGSVAHDHHNVMVVGADDVSMRTAVDAVVGAGGGFAVADGHEVRALLPLPVGGLMSARPIEDVRAAYDDVVEAAQALGSPLHDPFMALSFLGLEVIPSLKITDRGLVDVEDFQIVGIWTGNY
jgi:adenine deaminase